MYKFTCTLCGNEFESKAKHAKYCPDCRMKIQVVRNREYAERKANGTVATIGSTKVCPFCGNTYTVASGTQKCCKDCQHKMDTKRKVATNQKYTDKTYDSLRIYVPKGQRDVLKTYAADRDMSVNKLILSALEEYFEKHGKPVTESEKESENYDMN